MTSAHPRIGDIFQLEPEALKCPYPAYDRLREEAPVTYVPEAEAWLVSRYDDISHISRHPELFSSEMPSGPVMVRDRQAAVAEVLKEDPELGAELALLRGGTRVLFFADPPDHPRQRKLVNRAFTPGKIRGHEPVIREFAEKLVDAMVAKGRVDVVGDLGVPLPLAVIAHLLGIPDADLPQFKHWSDAVVKSIGNNKLTLVEVRETLLTQYEFFKYLKGLIAEHRANPGEDLICDVLAATIDDQPLSDAEAMNVFLQFLVAGNETTTDLITAAVHALCDDPDLADRLRDDTDKIRGFVEEMLRLEPPVQGLYRTVLHDTEVGGVQLKAGEHLMMVYAAGNRDESHFSSASQLDECRREAVHLSFGVGPHHCLGASLARAEAVAAIEALLVRTCSIRRSDDDELPFHASYVFRGIERLPVQLAPAHG